MRPSCRLERLLPEPAGLARNPPENPGFAAAGREDEDGRGRRHPEPAGPVEEKTADLLRARSAAERDARHRAARREPEEPARGGDQDRAVRPVAHRPDDGSARRGGGETGGARLAPLDPVRDRPRSRTRPRRRDRRRRAPRPGPPPAGRPRGETRAATRSARGRAGRGRRPSRPRRLRPDPRRERRRGASGDRPRGRRP